MATYNSLSLLRTQEKASRITGSPTLNRASKLVMRASLKSKKPMLCPKQGSTDHAVTPIFSTLGGSQVGCAGTLMIPRFQSSKGPLSGFQGSSDSLATPPSPSSPNMAARTYTTNVCFYGRHGLVGWRLYPHLCIVALFTPQTGFCCQLVGCSICYTTQYHLNREIVLS